MPLPSAPPEDDGIGGPTTSYHSAVDTIDASYDGAAPTWTLKQQPMPPPLPPGPHPVALSPCDPVTTPPCHAPTLSPLPSPSTYFASLPLTITFTLSLFAAHTTLLSCSRTACLT